MKFHRLVLTANHDQFEGKKIEENPFGLEIAYKDIAFESNWRIFIEIWKESNPSDKRNIQIHRVSFTTAVGINDTAYYQVRIPFDNFVEETLCFKVRVLNADNKILCTSFKQTILPKDQVIPPSVDEELENEQAYDKVTNLITSIETANERINEILYRVEGLNWDITSVIREWLYTLNETETGIEDVYLSPAIVNYIDNQTQYVTDKAEKNIEYRLKDLVSNSLAPSLVMKMEVTVENKYKEYQTKLTDLFNQRMEEYRVVVKRDNEELSQERNNQLAQAFNNRVNEFESYYGEELLHIQQDYRTKVDNAIAQINTDIETKIEELLTNIDTILGQIVIEDDTNE